MRKTAREWVLRRKGSLRCTGQKVEGLLEEVQLDLGFKVWEGFRKAGRIQGSKASEARRSCCVGLSVRNLRKAEESCWVWLENVLQRNHERPVWP